MKDNFSQQANAYSAFRPHYPEEMIRYIVDFVRNRDEALDVATGNGQVAIQLSSCFKAVHATDISAKQLAEATTAPNVWYKLMPAEKSDFADHQFDLITVAQAIHWFNFNTFYNEVYRILKPDGIFAVLGYGLLSTNEHTDVVMRDFYRRIVGTYWDDERKYIDENYATIPFPFEELPVRKFENQFEWSFEQLIGYLGTWSAVQHYKNQNGADPVGIIYDELRASWEASDRKVVFPLLLRIGKLK